MGLRRGFKTEAEWYAQDVRAELGLRRVDPLCPWQLATHLAHEVTRLSAFRASHPDEVAILHRCTGAKGFSAVTLYKGGARLVVLNDAHAPTRQAADLAHEMAHALLHHRPLPLYDGSGVRCFDNDDEEEARWLGPALLVPAEAALAVARSATPISLAAVTYGVSQNLMALRVNATGARKRAMASS